MSLRRGREGSRQHHLQAHMILLAINKLLRNPRHLLLPIDKILKTLPNLHRLQRQKNHASLVKGSVQ